MNIETLFELDKKQAKIDDFVANLKKNPKQISEYKNLVLNGDLEPKEQAQMMADIPHLKDKGFLIDDIPVTWEEHKESTPKGSLPFKLSDFKQLSGDDFSIVTSVKLHLYDDCGGHGSKITHYSANHGLDVSCGQNKPQGVRIVEIDAKNPDDMAKFNQAKKTYESRMKNWQSVKKNILQNRGETLTPWMKLDKSIIDNENQVIEKQERAEYKAWQRANKPPRIFSKPISKTLDHRK